jgi:hypothetical protein
MTLPEAIATQPAWIGLWLKWLTFGAFLLPLALIIWRQTRLAALLALLSGILGAIGTGWLYEQMGYVKLLGLPHMLLWTPFAIYLWALMRHGNLPKLAKLVVFVVLTTILVSLAFDYTDVIRYALGERAPLITTPGG